MPSPKRARPARPVPSGGSADPWQGWKPFGLFLGGGFLLVFLVEMVFLVLALNDFQAGPQRGAVWAMLLMIGATFFAVTVIGGGLFVSIRRQRREREAAGSDPSSGNA